jgi:2'-hydroxyisoflavone reductase
MRLLVLGGTSYLSQQVARDAVRRGHEVVCAARGKSGSVPEGARLVVIDRDEPGAIEALRGERFDVVVDVATGALGWVRDALDVLADTVGHWIFVSSVNVYSDTATPGQRVGAPLHPPVTTTGHLVLRTEMTVAIHGGIKVASEDAVRGHLGEEHSLIVRPGIISGPGDVMDRIGYWANRFARGGRTVVPARGHVRTRHARPRARPRNRAGSAEPGRDHPHRTRR